MMLGCSLVSLHFHSRMSIEIFLDVIFLEIVAYMVLEQ